MSSIIQEKINTNPLYFFQAAKWYDHLRNYAYGQIKPVLCPQGTIPPFQIIKTDGFNIASISLISFKTQTETDVKTEMELTGWEVLDFSDDKGYFIYRYPGTVPLPGITTTEGIYFLRMEDYNGEYILSELFSFIDDIDQRRDIIKVEWWHQEDFEYGCTLNSDNEEQAVGHIDYDFPFKYWAYVKSDVAKPTYQYENRVVNRRGKTLPLEQIRYKDHRFTCFGTESFADAFSLIPLHDQVRITHMGREYDPDEVTVEAEPSSNGDVFAIRVQFKTNMVAVVNGRAYTDLSYEEENGACLTNFQASAIITNGSDEYNNFYFTRPSGDIFYFQPGVLVIIDNGAGILTVKKYNGSSYVSAGLSDYDNVYTLTDARTNPGTDVDYYYYLRSGTLNDAPNTTTYTAGTPANLVGYSFGSSLVQIILKDADGNEWVAATGTSETFRASGIDFYLTKQGRTATAYKARAVSYVCGTISDSDWVALMGVGFDDVGGTGVVYTGTGDQAPNPFDDVDNN